jgi:hypothetical protein
MTKSLTLLISLINSYFENYSFGDQFFFLSNSWKNIYSYFDISNYKQINDLIIQNKKIKTLKSRFAFFKLNFYLKVLWNEWNQLCLEINNTQYKLDKQNIKKVELSW